MKLLIFNFLTYEKFFYMVESNKILTSVGWLHLHLLYFKRIKMLTLFTSSYAALQNCACY